MYQGGLKAQLSDILQVEVTEAKCKKICSLWAGMGSIERISAKTVSGDSVSLIIKVINAPKTVFLSEGDERKMKSYKVECNFYQSLNERLLQIVAIPKIFSVESSYTGDMKIIMSDLSCSFPIEASISSKGEKVHAAIKWLAKFHAAGWGKGFEDTYGLWPEGGYWYLGTRLEEWKTMGSSLSSSVQRAAILRLKTAAPSIARRLNDRGSGWTLCHGDFKVPSCLYTLRTIATASYTRKVCLLLHGLSSPQTQHSSTHTHTN